MKLMFLNGTAMSGQPDHDTIAAATPLGPARTAPHYRFFAVRDEFPGLLPVQSGGAEVVGELYEMTDELLLNRLLPGEPAELELGTVKLGDGRVVNAMRLRPDRIAATDKVVDITALGGWRAYQEFLAANARIGETLGR